MITEQALQEAIVECHGQRNPDAKTCLKLASYYTILDHINPKEAEPYYPEFFYRQSGAEPEEKRYTSDSEFGRLAGKIPYEDLMKTIDELCETLRVFTPKLYNAFIRKLTALR